MLERQILTLDILRTEQAKSRQERFFRALCDPRRGGETLVSISKAASIPYETIRCYAGHKGEPSVMSYANFIALEEAFPEFIGILRPAKGGEE